MISALLLPLFLAASQVNIGAAPSGDPAIRLWINNDGRFLPGDHVKVQVRAKDDGYILVLEADPDGQLRVLFPLDPGDDNFVRGGERFEVKGRGGGEAFDIDGSWGRGMVYAAISRDRFRFDGYRLGDHWDYRALAPFQLPRGPEAELTDLVGRMAPGDFDYDVLTYDVIERVVYASDYSSVPGDFFISSDFFFGRPFRRFDSPFFDPFFFDPFFFDPFFHRRFFFDPFFRDPFFHRGLFFDPFFDPFRFDPFLHRGFFFDPFFRRRFFQQPVLVHRFFHRPFFGPRGPAPVPYRDRRDDFRRAVNTAHLTPWRARGAAAASRGRRGEFRSGSPVRLAVPDARRRAIEARRDNWPVDVSPRLRGRVTDARRLNWPMDVSPRRRGLVGEARRGNWPVDVSPRRQDPDRLTGVRPQIDGRSLSGARRAWGIEGRPGPRMAPSGRGGRGGDHGGWWSSFGRGSTSRR